MQPEFGEVGAGVGLGKRFLSLIVTFFDMTGSSRSQRGSRPRPPGSAVGGASTLRALVTGIEAVPFRLGLRCPGSDIRCTCGLLSS